MKERKKIDVIETNDDTKTLQEVLEETVPTKKFVVNVALLNVRNQPEVNAKIVTTLPAGTIIEGTVVGDWVKINDGEFVMKKFVK